MLEKQPVSDQRIMDCLRVDYGIRVVRLIFLPLGADMQASVYKAETHDRASYFVKLRHSHFDEVGPLIMTLLQEAGIKQIIPLLKTIHGQSTQRIDGFILTVSPFIEGQDGFSCVLTSEQWITFGKALRQIHEINVPIPIQARIQQESYSPKWRAAVRSFYAYIESEPRGDAIALKLLTLMKQHIASIQRLVERAEELSQKLQEQHHEFLLCHSDIHGGNLLIDKNGSIYIVDWDAPIMALKERDLMFIGGGVGNVWNKPQEQEFFYKGYGSVEVNREILAYYRHERIVEDIALYGQQLLLTRAGGQDRIASYEHFAAQFKPDGVVEMAFKADENLAI